DKSQKRDAHDSWHKYRRRFIGHARNRCFTALCFRERVHHVAEVEGVGLVKSGKAEFAELTLPKFSDGVWEIASAVTVSVNGK
ncbi:hypothetical protein, partial [Neisseria gonorrhoeae]|uniref:hypothetical protein n=1 Tax=Neisseria gonorrhoeae TaxID=485 RepID=UPI00384A8A52